MGTIQSSLLFCTVKILILHQHFNVPQTGGALRSYFLAKALVEKGHQAVVITTHNQKHFLQTTLEGIEINYLPIAYNNAFGFYRRVRAFLSFIVKSVRVASSISDIDKCYAMSTPLTVGLAAIVIKWRRGIPFLFEVGDLWPDAPVQLGFIRNTFLKFFLYKVELFIYRQSESVVALSTQMKKIIEGKIQDKPVHLIPNMADLAFFTSEPKQPVLVKKFDVEGHFVISYIGSIGYANGLEFFLDCARLTQKNALPIKLLLCGEGAMLPHLKDTVRKEGIKNVIFVPFQNRAGVKEVMNITDAVFICYRQHSILETGSPNKYFDGLAAGKLIVTNFGGWIKEEIEKEKCGFGIVSNSPEDFVKRIDEFVYDNALFLQSQKNASNLSKKYNRKKLGDEFVNILLNE